LIKKALHKQYQRCRIIPGSIKQKIQNYVPKISTNRPQSPCLGDNRSPRNFKGVTMFKQK
jgi:hypothetical protein